MERKWEYKTIVFSKRRFFTSQFDWKEFDIQLNKYGNIGWEMISSISNSGPFITGDVTIILKRQKFEDHD